ncbi:hypothetical protein PSPO01_01133 [Paraphaeosphaeria sporulosa]
MRWLLLRLQATLVPSQPSMEQKLVVETSEELAQKPLARPRTCGGQLPSSGRDYGLAATSASSSMRLGPGTMSAEERTIARLSQSHGSARIISSLHPRGPHS